MSGLILCREKTVTHPYYVTELGIHLYTGEELSYFICHNILLIDEDFLDERLFDFLEQLGETRLCERARRLSERYGIPAFLYDVVPTDEVMDIARVRWLNKRKLRFDYGGLQA